MVETKVAELVKRTGTGRGTRYHRTPMTFTKLTSYDQTDALLMNKAPTTAATDEVYLDLGVTDGRVEMVETDMDGHPYIAFMIKNRCIGVWYQAAQLGSFCMDFSEDEESYVTLDPFWPHGD